MEWELKKIINKLCTNKYLRYNSIEDWEHVIRCEGINNIKSQFINTLKEKLNKIKTNA